MQRTGRTGGGSLVVAVLATLLAVGASRAHAREGDRVESSELSGRAAPSGLPVALDIDRFVSVDPARLTELLMLELRVLSDPDLPAPRPPTRVRIRCDGGAYVV